jgi:hypothetical protein
MFLEKEVRSDEKTKLNECEKTVQCTQESPRWIRPILLFNKDDSIFHTNMQSKLNDRWNTMIQDQKKNRDFTREVEVNQNDSKELKLTFDLKDYKVGKIVDELSSLLGALYSVEML